MEHGPVSVRALRARACARLRLRGAVLRSSGRPCRSRFAGTHADRAGQRDQAAPRHAGGLFCGLGGDGGRFPRAPDGRTANDALLGRLPRRGLVRILLAMQGVHHFSRPVLPCLHGDLHQARRPQGSAALGRGCGRFARHSVWRDDRLSGRSREIRSFAFTRSNATTANWRTVSLRREATSAGRRAKATRGLWPRGSSSAVPRCSCSTTPSCFFHCSVSLPQCTPGIRRTSPLPSRPCGS